MLVHSCFLCAAPAPAPARPAPGTLACHTAPAERASREGPGGSPADLGMPALVVVDLAAWGARIDHKQN
eukprot:1987696-Pyramimonas_sp.AAC.1